MSAVHIPVPESVYVMAAEPGAIIPSFHSPGAAGFDLHTNERAVIEPGKIARVSTGLVIATPRDHMLYITFRSSTPVRHGVMVLEGICDEDYRGETDVLGLQLWNFTQEMKTIEAGTRLAQGIFIPITRADFTPVQNMEAMSRGGWGSTG